MGGTAQPAVTNGPAGWRPALATMDLGQGPLEAVAMRTLVIYESMFGNTEHVARAIAEGVGNAEVVEVGLAPTRLPPDVGLVIIGGPTHVHGMSRGRTRSDAGHPVDRPIISPGIGIREWIDRVEPADVPIAAFDTRVGGPQLLTGSAAKSATHRLERRGFAVLAPESFVLERAPNDPFDQVPASELERARAWGQAIGSRSAVFAG
jgi:hypothetical protein